MTSGARLLVKKLLMVRAFLSPSPPGGQRSGSSIGHWEVSCCLSAESAAFRGQQLKICDRFNCKVSKNPKPTYSNLFPSSNAVIFIDSLPRSEGKFQTRAP